MITVKCVKGYFDTQLNRHVDVNEEFEVTEERAKRLIKANVATTTTEKVAKGRKKREE